MMKVGFTGTRDGMTMKQISRLVGELLNLGCDELHHGDCWGADSQAHELGRALGLRIVIHPPKDGKYRAFKYGDEVRPEKEYLRRNRELVDEVEVLIAGPKGPEVGRSGTWSTVRYAMKKGVRTIVLVPDED